MVSIICVAFEQINLKAGRNVIIWQATAITYGGSGESSTREPVHIKSIEIQGLVQSSYVISILW